MFKLARANASWHVLVLECYRMCCIMSLHLQLLTMKLNERSLMEIEVYIMA